MPLPCSRVMRAPLLPLLCVAVMAVLLTACGQDSPSHPPPEATETVQLHVENMSCRTCPVAVRRALDRVDGVHSAEVDYDRATATVVYDPSLTSVATLSAATTDAGFPSHPKPSPQ